VQRVCTQGLNLFRTLMIYLKPVLPFMADKANRFFDEPEWIWNDAGHALLGRRIRAYEPLATRLDPRVAARLVDAPAPAPSAATPSSAARPASSAAAGSPAAPAGVAPPAHAAPASSISIDEFGRIDLRVAKILSAEHIEGADKLLKLRVDLGELGTRQIFAGIRAACDPAAIIGKLVVVVANLAPRKMRFGVSEGMLLAAGPGGKDLFVVGPESGALPGMRVK
jgi:methionyl-tRNA synthetase